MPHASRPLPRSVRVGYGLGSVATGTFGTVPGLLLLPYLTDTLGVAAGLAGLVVLLPKAWDVVLNPVAGRVSDRSEDPRGRRRPFLLRAGLLLAVCFALLFGSPGLGSRAAETVWVLVLFVACASAYAFFQVPYVAMPAEMTDDHDERTRLMTWRVAVLALAIMASGATAPAVQQAVGGRAGYRVMGVVVALLLVVGTLGAYLGTRRAPTGRAVPADTGTLREQLRVVGGDRDFRLLLTTFVVQALAIGAMLAGVAYVARWVLGRESASSVLFVCFVGPALLLSPVWAAAARRLGVRRATCWRRWCWPPPRCCWSAHGRRRRGGCTPRPRWSAPATRASSCSRSRCSRRRRPRRPCATARLAPGFTPGSGQPGRPSGWRSAPRRTPGCWRWAATSPATPPAAASPSPARPSTRSCSAFSAVPAALVLLSLLPLRRCSLGERPTPRPTADPTPRPPEERTRR